MLVLVSRSVVGLGYFVWFRVDVVHPDVFNHWMKIAM